MQAVFSKSIFRALLSNVSIRSSSNVSNCVDGLRHLIKNVSANCIALTVSCGELKIARKFIWDTNSIERGKFGRYLINCSPSVLSTVLQASSIFSPAVILNVLGQSCI